MIFLYLVLCLKNSIHTDTNQYILPFFTYVVRHKCGTAAAQSRTKIPDLCNIERKSAVCGLKFISVCSEVLRSPLPLIKNSVTVPFLFWCALGTHLVICFYGINIQSAHLRTYFLLQCVTRCCASNHPCKAIHYHRLLTLLLIKIAINTLQSIITYTNRCTWVFNSFSTIWTHITSFSSFNFIFIYFIFYFLFFFLLLLTISYLISVLISELKSENLFCI